MKSKRPKDMTAKELDALPERGAFGLRYIDSICPKTGFKKRTPVMEPARCVAWRPDDIMAWVDKSGKAWCFGQAVDGSWFKSPASYA